jgi:ATP-dependent DNA helicase DinG
MSTILSHFPYKQARQLQAEVLEVLESNWSRFDVFVIVAPTAAGKSAIMKTIMDWKHSASGVTPNNLLVDQFRREFPNTAKLRRLDSYECAEWKAPCVKVRARLKGFCKGCECGKDMSVAKYRGGPGIYTYHTYIYQKLYRDVLVADEAHNIPGILGDLHATRIWRHDYNYPNEIHDIPTMKRWIQSLPSHKQKHKKIKQLWDAITDPLPRHVVERKTDWFNGKGTKRGEPEERDCIVFYDINPADSMPVLVPNEVKKLVLMSGTVNRIDIEDLGLQNRRVLYVEAKSPIDPARRPVVIQPVTSVSYKTLTQDVDRLAAHIRDVLLPHHLGEKGVVHVTYGMAKLLHKYFGSDPRFIFHEAGPDKKEKYEMFRRAPASSGKVLVACGMYEGIDLPEDLGRWQVVAKVPWKSLASPAIKHKADLKPEWYAWQAAKDLIQACGRICRTEKDYGVTYILDDSVKRLLFQYEDLIPNWFKEGVVFDE